MSVHEYIVDQEASKFAADYYKFNSERNKSFVDERQAGFAKLEAEFK